MPSPDFEPQSDPENKSGEERLDRVLQILNNDYGLKPNSIRKWFQTAIGRGTLEDGLMFHLKPVSRNLADSPLFHDLADMAAKSVDDGQQEVDPTPFIELNMRLAEEEIAEAEIPLTEKERLIAQLPERAAALEETMRVFPQRRWESKEKYLCALQEKRTHIKILMTLIIHYEPMLILQVTDITGPSSLADFRGVIYRAYYGPENSLFNSLAKWIQHAHELMGKDGREELARILASRG